MYSIKEIADWLLTQSTTQYLPHPEKEIRHLVVDSRSPLLAAGSLFFALSGIRHDGHQFIQEVYAKGGRNFVVSRVPLLSDFPDANFIGVPNTLAALQYIAQRHRAQFDIPIIGITGSNGKTIVKEWLYQLLHTDKNMVRSPRSYNSQLGVPLSVWQLQPTHELGIFEAGISQTGEMQHLQAIIQPTIGILTNIGDAHNEGFQDAAEKLHEKIRLFLTAKVIICEVQYQATIKAAFPNAAFAPSLTDIVQERLPATHSTQLTARYNGEVLTLQIPFSDAAAIHNAQICWQTLLYLGYPNEVIQARMWQLQPVQMRLEVKEGINGCILINDTYNADSTSLQIALDFLEEQGTAKKTLILSELLQTRATDEVYAHIATLLQTGKLTRFIGVGAGIREGMRALEVAPTTAVHFFDDTATLLRQVNALQFDKETILIKGARTYELERIVHRLARKAHRTVLEVNLNALKHNLNVFGSLLQPHVKTMAMVKAAAYGVGSEEVARLLSFQKVDYLCVAYADEGIALRQAGIATPIMVLNPESTVFDAMLRYQLEPELYSMRLLQEFMDFAASTKAVVRIHLKLDTGMHRLGFEAADLSGVVALLRGQSEVQVASVFSHLVASEDAQHDAFTHQQAATFCHLYEELAAGLGYRPWRHLLNSGGIVRFREYQFEMVRLGIGLYGYDSSELLQTKLALVHTLKATISQIKKVAAGDTVGYGRRGLITAPARIATISIGYADGFPRKAGNGNYHVWLHQQLAPTIGNVCMDMSMINITHIPEAQEGDEVIVFGQQPTVQDLAACVGTIPYEIFTSLSERVKRVYYQE